MSSAVAVALEEDRARQDVTTLAVVPAGQRGSAVLRAREAGVLCGLEAAREAFAQLSGELAFVALAGEGSSVQAGDALAEISGPLAPLLQAERVALNFVQRLSGIATLTRRLVERAAAGGPARVVDTRKTTPGLRALERYAVRVGGAFNHRNTLEDGVLIKDNHLRAGEARGASIAELVREARGAVAHTLRVEVEVTDEEGARSAAAAGADVILLDNMSPREMREIVERAGDGRVLFEASGGITLETVGAVAASGVDLISSGALTHSAPALDVALDVAPGPGTGSP
ncbi:MAG: carboxylating nicotinate-nucleotide diphosphorylase [Chloroflexi bacterium]|nr:carboxylating nicotinate-nucleotide diphosphorylase [Chloroflexota bacterium]